jgi:hypothetical protein
MIRTPLFVTLLCLAACQQGSRAPANNATAANVSAAPTANAAAPTNAASPKAAPARAAVPASYDWTFATHGGSGELVFGDGDLAEGVSLLNFSCLPGSGQAEVSGMGEGETTLQAEGASVTVASGAPLAMTHPVIRGLQASGSVTLVSGAEERALMAKPGAGRVAIESFIAYCSQG